jgi:hypothetical protein
MNYNVRFSDPVTVDRLPSGRWRAYSGAFRLSTYGDTSEDAKAKNDVAVTGIVRTMLRRGGPLRLRNRFLVNRVPYRLTQDGNVAMYSETLEREFGAVGV